MAAFRPDDADERNMRLEDHGQHVRVENFYPDWDGNLADLTEAALLVDGSEGGRSGSAVPAPSEIDSFVAAGEALLETMGRFLDAPLEGEAA